MLHFDCDYMEGAHPAIMARLVETNLEQTPGYGADRYTQAAKDKVREACACPRAEVHFLVGGTQANATVIDALLRPWHSVLAVSTGHIAVHEAGAIEATGHKVVVIEPVEGKLRAQDLKSHLDAFLADPTHEHMPAPGMVSISHPSETGTLYAKAELEAIRALCDEHGLALFMDGARLGYGLASPEADLTLPDISRLCDVFTIGGTKVGALFGDAVVFPDAVLAGRFFTLMKQHGAVLAKGRLLGLQFDTLFTDGLYFEISRHAIDMAMKLREAFISRGYALFAESPTNQQFVILDNGKMAELGHHATFEFWGPYDEGRSVVRFATSWATREEDVDALAALL